MRRMTDVQVLLHAMVLCEYEERRWNGQRLSLEAAGRVIECRLAWEQVQYWRDLRARMAARVEELRGERERQ